MSDIVWNELYWEEEEFYYADDDIDYALVRRMDKYPDKNEKVFVRFENGDIKTAVYDGYDFGEYDREDIDAWAKIPEEFKE